MSLGSSILFVLLIATLAFALSSLSLSHLSLMNRSSSEQMARNLARSVVARAIDRLLEDQGFGVEREGVVLDVAFSGSSAWLAFDQDQARSRGILYSTNNLEGTNAVEGAAGPVPAAAAHLVGVGHHAGTTVTVETYLHVPAFPYAVASAGPIRSSGGLLVAGLKGEPEGPALELEPATMGTADIASNSGAEEAVWLAGVSTIRGDLQAAGRVIFEAEEEVAVLGEVRNYAEPVELPELTFDDYDPRVQGLPHQTLASDFYNEGPTILSGSTVREGGLTVEGGLKLEGGVLLVEGDLVVRGGLEGEGIVMVEGDVTIEGGTELRGGNELALMARGDVKLSGSGNRGSYFQGLVYTGGGVEADSISVVGTLIARGEEQVKLHDVRLLLPEDGGAVEVTVNPNASTPGAGPGTINPGVMASGWVVTSATHVTGGGNRPGPGTRHFIGMRTTPGGIIANGPGGTLGPYPTVDETVAAVLADFAGRGYPVLPGSSVEQDMVASYTQEFIERGGLNGVPEPEPVAPEPEVQPPEPGEAVVYTVDPSRFLKFEDRVRLLYWRE